MIDEEEDDYERLFHKDRKQTLWKILKGVALISLMIVAYFLVQIGMGTEGGFTWTLTGFMLLCVGSLFINVKKPKEEDHRQTLCVLKCTNPECEHVLVRDFMDGDYVHKHAVPCSKCTRDMEVTKIYSVKIVPATREEIAQKLAKESEFRPRVF